MQGFVVCVIQYGSTGFAVLLQLEQFYNFCSLTMTTINMSPCCRTESSDMLRPNPFFSEDTLAVV